MKLPAEPIAAGARRVLAMLWLMVLTVPATPSAHGQSFQAGLAYLESSQAADGAWGDPAATQARDATVVVDTLALLGARSGVYLRGTAAVATLPSGNNDDLARATRSLSTRGLDVAATTQTLLAAQHEEVLDPSAPAFPGRGWGLAPGFGVTALDTALVLRALRGAGLPSGLSIVAAEVAASSTSSPHPFPVPAGAGNLYLKVRQLSATLRFTLTNPTGAAYFADVAPASTPITIGPFPISEGEWTLMVRNTGAGPATYTAEVGYTDADGFDSFRIATALTFLGLSQNPDGGWGIAPGGDSQLMVTAEVARTLATSDGVFPTVLSAATAWLQARQNPDGGFGSEPGVSNVNETALAALSIGLADGGASLDAAASYLETQQQANGSWGDDAYLTAAAMQALLLARPLDSAPEVTSSGGAGAGGDFVTDRPEETITGTLGFGAVDVQVNLPGATVEVDTERGTFAIRLPVAEGANALTITAIDGFGRSMGADAVTVTRDDSLLGQDLLLQRGLNLVGLGLDPANPLSAIGLLELFGTHAQTVQRLDAATGTYAQVTRNGTEYDGNDFPVAGLDSLVITTDGAGSAHLAGTPPAADTVDLLPGVNALTIPQPPLGLDAYQLLGQIGDETAVSAIRRYNPTTGAFETAVYDAGAHAGENFPIESGVSYQVHMRRAELGFVLPRQITASIRIRHPTDGASVSVSPILVDGLVGGEAPFTVTVNGHAATVTGTTFEVAVPLTAGANLIQAQVVDGGDRTANDAVSVNYDDLVDHRIPPGGSATGTRAFTAEAAVLDRIAFYTVEPIGIPAGLVYTTTAVTRVSATEIEVGFRIDVDTGAAPGTYDFQVEYALLDADSNPLGPLDGNLLEFRIEVTP